MGVCNGSPPPPPGVGATQKRNVATLPPKETLSQRGRGVYAWWSSDVYMAHFAVPLVVVAEASHSGKRTAWLGVQGWEGECRRGHHCNRRFGGSPPNFSMNSTFSLIVQKIESLLKQHKKATVCVDTPGHEFVVRQQHGCRAPLKPIICTAIQEDSSDGNFSTLPVSMQWCQWSSEPR